MPELRVADRQFQVAAGSNLLDALLGAGIAIPYSCRAGSCQACMVRCLHGEPRDDRPDALDARRRDEGWRLACQCRVIDDLQVQAFDPQRDGRPAEIQQCDWLCPDLLRLRLVPLQPLRYAAGQHLLLWADGVARPYSLASLPGEDGFLEFHIDCSRPGAFASAARQFAPGQRLGLGALRGGALHYASEWQAKPLLLMAAGTGLAPLYGVLREALRQQHSGPIQLIHLARAGEHYLAAELAELALRHSQLQVETITRDALDERLARLRPPRQTQALLCGQPQALESFAKRLYLAGLPRGQVLADAFLPHA